MLNPSILIVWIQLWVVGLKMSEGGICQSPDCAVCRIKLGLEVRSPSGPIREEIFDPMERPVLDSARKGHYVAAAKTRDYIREKELTFEDLKRDMPGRNSN